MVARILCEMIDCYNDRHLDNLCLQHFTEKLERLHEVHPLIRQLQGEALPDPYLDPVIKHAAAPTVEQRTDRLAVLRYRTKAKLLRTFGGKCVDCGRTYHQAAMGFDHILGQKLFPINEGIRRGYSYQRLYAEAKKCEVRCINCLHIKKFVQDPANAVLFTKLYITT